MNKKVFRIIDSNCNRCAEGLRVLEDIARMMLNDAALSKNLKEVRHGIIDNLSTINVSLISQRDTDNDVGSYSESIVAQNELSSIIMANAKRAEEGLRVIEEMSKLSDLNQALDSNRFKHFRFEVYKIEQELLSRTQRISKINQIKGVYAILDTGVLKSKDIMETARQIIDGGANIIQLRDKLSNTRELISISRDLQKLCHDNGVLFIINDYLDIALASDADGLHLGQNDLPISIARSEMPIDKIIGCSVQTIEQARKAIEDGADYIAAGSIFSTNTKEDITVIGLNLIKQLKSESDLPLVAIGGIKLENAIKVIDAGADSIAIISAILNSDNIRETTSLFAQKFES
jgi:thiamine-phosphate pyrophosphorylase